MRKLAKNYTVNQIGAIASLLAGSLWAVAAVVAILLTGSQSASSLMFFALLEIIDWIGIPLYIKRIRWSYIVIIIVWIIGLVGLVAMTGTFTWYTFHSPVFQFSIIIFYLISIAGIYFSYKSYQELK
jgi:drug/metabolite transporter (DMT)-like permease